MDRLSPDERARLGSLTARVDCDRVRLHRISRPGAAGALRSVILWASRGRAVALGNHVFLPDALRDRPGHPGARAHPLRPISGVGAVALLCSRCRPRSSASSCTDAPAWARARTHYRMEEGKPFEAYGMEQQGQIVEDSFRVTGRHSPCRHFALRHQDAPSA